MPPYCIDLSEMSRIISHCSISTEQSGLVGMYRALEINYPKFFKMDNLCKAGFIAAEIVLDKAGLRSEEPKPDMSIVLVNSSSSTVDDIEFQKGLADGEYFPSPSLFVYTLSNVVCGEIAIRNKILGETSFYVQKEFSPEFLVRAVGWTLADDTAEYVLCGWVECLGADAVCNMMLVKRNSSDGENFDIETIERIFNK